MTPLCLGLEILVLGARLCLGDPAAQTVRICPALEEMSPTLQRQLAAEIRALPSGSATEQAAGQLLRLRDQVRACRK